MAEVLTHKGPGIERAILTPVKVKNLMTGDEIDTYGVWDTGATNSVITKAAAERLGVTVVSMTEVGGVHGKQVVPVYDVQLTLNNQNISLRVRVSEGNTSSFSFEGNADILIGMDIITKGDFCISNFDGQTVMTFRVPSLTAIDYCKEVEEYNRCLKIHNLNVQKHLPDKCACGSGRDFKNCHGKSPYFR